MSSLASWTPEAKGPKTGVAHFLQYGVREGGEAGEAGVRLVRRSSKLQWFIHFALEVLMRGARVGPVIPRDTTTPYPAGVIHGPTG